MRVPISSLGAYYINPYTGEYGGQGDPLAPSFLDRPVNLQADLPPDYTPPIYVLPERPPDYSPPIYVLPLPAHKVGGGTNNPPYYDENGAVQHTLRSSGSGAGSPNTTTASTTTSTDSASDTQVAPLNLGIMVVAIVGLFIMAKR